MDPVLNKSNLAAIHYNNAINDKFADVSSPLFNSFPITHFFYIKVFDDNRCLYLCNDKKWVEHYVDNNFQDDPLHFKSYIPNDMAFSLWSGFEKDKVYSAAYDFNIWNGFNIYEKDAEGSIITYAFGSSRSNVRISNFYINNIDILKNFILYFKNKSSDIIDPSDMGTLIMSKAKRPCKSSSLDCNPFLKAIKEDRYPARYKDRKFSLTKREMECLQMLSMGNTMKESAKVLGLSPRTIEQYVNNIKQKSNIIYKSDLVKMYYESFRDVLSSWSAPGEDSPCSRLIFSP